MDKTNKLLKKILEQKTLKIINEMEDGNEQSTEVLEEGKFANWGMALALLLTPLSTALGQSQDKEKDIKSAIELSQRNKDVKEIAQKLAALKTDVSFDDVMKQIEHNAKQLQKMQGKSSKKTTTKHKTAETPEEISKALEKGFSITNIKKIIESAPEDANALVVSYDSTLNIGSDEGFTTGGYVLSEETKNEIQSLIKEINENGSITSITIEASTDAEFIEMGNEKLAQLRARSIRDLLINAGVKTEIKVTTLPEQGSDVVSKEEFKSNSTDETKLAQLRDQTKDFRYVKITIDAEADVCVNPEEVIAPETIEREIIELTKIVKKAKFKKPPVTKLKKAKWSSKSTKCPRRSMAR